MTSKIVLIRLVARADGKAHPLDGLWLKSFDPDGCKGHGEVTGTKRRADAMRFTDMPAAMKFWRKTSTVLPMRPDGQPNRPLTAFTIEVERE